MVRVSLGISVAALILAAIATAQIFNLSSTLSSLGTVGGEQERIQKISAKIDSIDERLEGMSEELHEITETRQALDVMMTEHNRLVIMAGIHTSYQDLDSKLAALDSRLSDGDLADTGERIGRIKGIIAHVTWPDGLTRNIHELEEIIDRLHHAIEEREMDEVAEIGEEIGALREEMVESFYDVWLPSLVERPTMEYTLVARLGTEPPGFIGRGGEIEGLVNPDIVSGVHETLKITIVNGEDVPHDFVSEELHIHSEHITREGETTVLIFTPHKAGEFVYYCSVPGHREAGMEGRIIIE